MSSQQPPYKWLKCDVCTWYDEATCFVVSGFIFCGEDDRFSGSEEALHVRVCNGDMRKLDVWG